MSQQNPKYKYLIEEKQITLYADKVVLVESERFKQVTVNERGSDRALEERTGKEQTITIWPIRSR